ncbi:sialidase family protein [Kitasatospora herbaricolor]|uniref:sialidase family protein n=1 Tax=Kitasatospora herbaricolor TaxID=68217 RepID=UPI0036DF5468
MHRKRAALSTLGLTLVAATLGWQAPSSSAAEQPQARNYMMRAVMEHRPVMQVNGKRGQTLSGGVQQMILDQTDPARRGHPSESGRPVSSNTLGCSQNSGGNIRVNQDCTFRRQAEEQIAVDPTNPDHVIAGMNDNRIGFNHCGFAYSFDGGRRWGDGIPPFFQHLNPGTGHTYDAASDPGVAFDSRGNAYFSCVVADFTPSSGGLPASGLFVTTSSGKSSGSAYENVPFGPDAPYVVVENNDPAIFHDKPFIAADSHPGSPFRDNVYITWVRLECGDQGCVTPIYFSRSSDQAKTWSEPVKISGNNAELCVDGDQVPGVPGGADECNFSGGPSPVVGPDGTISVAFHNSNTPIDAQNQQLLVQSHDGGQTWSRPVKIGDDVIFSLIDGSPAPGCEFSGQCVPPPTNVILGDPPALSVDSTGKILAAVWNDFRNGINSDENYDIVLATSTDGGATWSSRIAYNDPTQTAQFQPAVAINQRNGAIAVSYYDRSVNNDAVTGRYDYSISLGRSATGQLNHQRVSTVSSLSPDFNPTQAGFLGDYSSVAWSGNTALPLWADGRNLDPSGQPDEDVFVARIPFGRSGDWDNHRNTDANTDD